MKIQPRISPAAMMILPLAFATCTQCPCAAPTPTQPTSIQPTPTAQKPAPAPAAANAANAAGTWSWTIDAGGNTITQSVKLTQSGEKLTGTFTDGFDNTTHDIKEGKIHDGQISLTVVRPFMDNGNLTLNFTGKLQGDAIAGKVEINIGDQPTTADWNAKRAGA